MKKQIAVFIVILFSLISLTLFGQTIPKYSGYINDFAGVLSVEQKNSLEKEVRDFEKKTSTEIAVLVVKYLQGYQPVVFAQKTFSEWKIGKKGANNGVLLLISIGNRKARIHTGYGLEGCFPDAVTYKIQRRNLVPAFKAGMYFDGIKATVLAIMETVKNEKFDTVSNKKTDKYSASQKFGTIVFVVSIFVILLVAIILIQFFYRNGEDKEQNTSHNSRRDKEESNYSPVFIASSISHNDDSSLFSSGDSNGGYSDSGCDFGGGDSGGGGSDSSW